MKKLFLIIIGAVCCLFVSDAQAQVKLMKDSRGTLLGYEDTDGTMYNNGSVPIVRMQDSLTIVVATGDTLASYNQSTKELRYENNDLILKLNGSNQIFDAADHLIGWIDLENNLYGADGTLKIHAPGISAFKLAYYFFYANR